MRILFVSQLFDPEYSIKGLGLMKHWVDKGHEVIVVTTFPNYPTGEIFSGYKIKLKEIEIIDGVKVVRLWSHISHSKSKISRASNYISFTLMALFYSIFCKKPDLLYTYHPQATTGLIGVCLKKLKKVPFITDVQDLWPDALAATGLNNDGLIVNLIDRWCRYIYIESKSVVVLSKGFRNSLIDRGVDSDKINLVYNWCPEEERIEEVLSTSGYQYQDNKPVSLVYAGNIGAAQSLKSLIDAVGLLPASSIELKLYGNGIEKEQLESYVIDNGYTNIFFEGYVAPSGIFNVLSQADILAVHLRDEDLFKITIPSKTQSSMAMNKPLLMAVGGEANDIVSFSKSGVSAAPQSVDSITKAIKNLLANSDDWLVMGDNARKFYVDNFSIESNYSRLDAVIEGGGD